MHAEHLSGFSDKFFSYKFDPDKAKALLKEAGLSSGFKTSLAYNAGDPVQEPIAILYQTALRDVGVELELKKIPPAMFYNTVSERKQPMIFYVDSPWCPDVGYSMTLYFNSKSFINYSNYKSDDVDALIRDTARTNDQSQRLTMMTKAQEIVMSEAPWTFIAYPGYHFARRANLKGFTYYTSNNIRFQDSAGRHEQSATSGSVIPAASPALAGETSKFHRLRFFLAFLRSRPSFAVGYAIVIVVIFVALFAPWLAPYGPVTADPNVYLLPPGGGHVLGTDGTGMDIFSRVLFAPRVDLAIAIIGTFLSAVIGGAIGALVGYYEGQRAWRRAMSTIVMRSADVLQAFPVSCSPSR